MKDSQNLKKKQRKFTKKKAHNSPQPPLIKKESKIRSFGKDILLLLIPCCLLIIFLTLILINNHFLQAIYASKITTFISSNKINPYPFVGEIPLLSLSAKAAIVVDADSQVVAFSKNQQLRFPMASTVKIMTALTALDYYKSNDILTIKSTGIEGSSLNLQPGEQFYFEDLLFAMLLPSANDAAVAIADNYPGGTLAFVAKMNEKANMLHLTDTHFVDPTGLEDSGDYTTVIDMAHLASAALKNKKIMEITGTKEKIIFNSTRNKQYSLHNLNKLLGTNGVTGIKTGTTTGAREVLVTSVTRGNHTFIIVVMNSTDRFGDTQTLLNFIDNNIQFISPIQF